ncbi:hypothetical protein H1Q58_12205 [Planococcus maritimus]|uniref:Uncharacterized protein n=1 Tax=Planococcus maritimus TaxID=192421 RepID=A0A7D7RKW5_PLAMR|nr:hypothetical protein [Planococcus maritimus]QMT16724.1 hypothetical protein H1Q58_12205 [Planococcus maritimus]
MMNMQQVISPSDKIKKQTDAAATAPLQIGESGIPETGEHKAPQLYIGLPMERGVSVQLYRDEQLGVNEAEILIPVDQVARLTRALIEHPLLLPTSYAQSSQVNDGQHILRIASKEALTDFVERLTDALDVLARTK